MEGNESYERIRTEHIGGKKRGREEGIQVLILDNQEEQVPKNRILEKLQKHFELMLEKAEYYYEKFAEKT